MRLSMRPRGMRYKACSAESAGVRDNVVKSAATIPGKAESGPDGQHAEVGEQVRPWGVDESPGLATTHGVC